MKAIRIIALVALFLSIGYPMAMAASDHAAPTAHGTTVPESATSKHDPAGPAAATNEADAPHVAAEEHGEGGLPQLRIDTYPSQMFWLLVTFAVLYVAFSKSVLPNIGSVIEMRESKIKGDLDAAEAMRAQSEEIRAAYEKGLEQARADATAAIADVEAAVKKKAEDRAHDFRKKSEDDVAAAEKRMDDVRAKSMGEMTIVAAEVATIAAEKITGVSGDKDKAKAIVESIAGKARAA